MLKNKFLSKKKYIYIGIIRIPCLREISREKPDSYITIKTDVERSLPSFRIVKLIPYTTSRVLVSVLHNFKSCIPLRFRADRP